MSTTPIKDNIDIHNIRIGGIYWTDYPIVELGDVPHQRAPIRKVIVWGFDGDKYCKVKVGGVRKEIKAGYIYTKPRRFELVRKREA